jgi:hypothetical protein
LLALGWWRYQTYYYTSDGFRYYRVLVNTLQGHWLWEGPYWGHMLAFHQFLLLPVALPLVWLWAHPFVLFGLLIGCVALGAWQVRAAALLLGAARGHAAAWAGFYLLLPTMLSNALGFDCFLFQNEAFLMALVPWTFRLWLQRSHWLGVAVFLTGLVKEEAYLWLLLSAAALWSLTPAARRPPRRVWLGAIAGFLVAAALTAFVRWWYADQLASTIYRFSPQLDHLTLVRVLAAMRRLAAQLWLPMLPLYLLWGYIALRTRQWQPLLVAVACVGGLLAVRAILSILVFGVDWTLVHTHAYWGNTQLVLLLFALPMLALAHTNRRLLRCTWLWPLLCYLWFNPHLLSIDTAPRTARIPDAQDRLALKQIAEALPVAPPTSTLLLSDYCLNPFVQSHNFLLAPTLRNVEDPVRRQWLAQVQGGVIHQADMDAEMDGWLQQNGLCPMGQRGKFRIYWRYQ